MATKTVTVSDGQGNVLDEHTVEVEDGPSTPDIVTLADELAATRARLDSAEDALFYLITDSLGGI